MPQVLLLKVSFILCKNKFLCINSPRKTFIKHENTGKCTFFQKKIGKALLI